ncbi:MAG: replicative DNA helicase [Candidatus Krumholzibacteriia bacterium]
METRAEHQEGLRDSAAPPRPGERQAPANLDAERAVLGAILLDREAVGIAREKIEGPEFYRKEHRLIYQAMCHLYEIDQAIDPITVAEALEKEGALAEAGGIDYVADLAAIVATAANVGYHAAIIKDKAVLRELIHASTLIAAEAYEGQDETPAILDRAQGRIYSVGEQARRGGFEGVDQVVPDTFKAIEEAFRNQSEVTGLRTGFKELDFRLSGLQPADLLILAARPSMGKTSLALNLAYNVATREDVGVAIFSLEMSAQQLVLRMLCSATGFNLHSLRRGKLEARDFPRLMEACDRLSRTPIYIDDTGGLSVLEMKSKTRRLQQQRGVGLVIIDYLQLMTSHARVENRQQEISQISRYLKGMAKDLNVPVVALSQLSRAVEARSDHKPMLSDLRESGSLEQDADVVMFIYREEVYRPDDPAVENLATIIIGKQRNGPTGQFDLHFHKEYTRFSDLVR